jgi:O-antigen ligase
MGFTGDGEPINIRRLALFVFGPLALLGVAACIFLPAGLVRFCILALLGLPAALFFLDRPKLIFYVLMIMLFSNLDIFMPPQPYRIVLSLVLASLAIAVVNGRRIVVHHPLLLAFGGAFVILAFQSLSVARDLDPAVSRLVYFLKCLIGVAVASQFVRDRREFRHFVLVVVVAILMNDFLPLVIKAPTKYPSLSYVWAQGVFRYEGFVFEPNAFALFQNFLIPLILYLIVAYRKKRLVLPLFAIAILAVMVVLTLSFSRGGFVSVAVLFALLLYIERRNKLLLGFSLVLVIAGLALSPAIYWDRIQSILEYFSKNRSDYAIYTRIETMKEALKLGLEHPLLGIGLDNFLYASASRLPYFMLVHNTFLQIFSDLGIPAFVVFMGILVCNFRLIRSLMQRKDLEASYLGEFLLVQHCAVLVGSLFIPVAYDTMFWFMLALPAFAHYAYRNTREAELYGGSGSMGRK